MKTQKTGKKELRPSCIIVPEARLAFPSLFKKRPRTADPAKKANEDEWAFQAVLLLPPETNLKPFHRAMQAAMIQKWGKVVQLPASKNPIHDCSEKPETNGYEDGWYYINAANKRPVAVVNRMSEPITDPSKIYAGCWCRVFLEAYAWKHQLGGQGVSFSLNGVQFLRDDERLDNAIDVGEVLEPLDATDGADDGDDADLGDLFG